MTRGAKIVRLRSALRRGRRRIARIVGFNRIRRRALKRLEAEHGATVMFDSVDLSQIPANAPAVAGYTSGNWPTWWELGQRFPHAQALSIAITAGADAECLDIETGDASATDAPGWVKRQLARGVRRPVVYTSVSNMDAVLGYLKAAGIKRHQVRVWAAHYTFTPHLCGPHSCGDLQSTTADATQWTDRALGRNLDESRVAAGFFE